MVSDSITLKLLSVSYMQYKMLNEVYQMSANFLPNWSMRGKLMKIWVCSWLYSAFETNNCKYGLDAFPSRLAEVTLFSLGQDDLLKPLWRLFFFFKSPWIFQWRAYSVPWGSSWNHWLHGCFSIVDIFNQGNWVEIVQ